MLFSQTPEANTFLGNDMDKTAELFRAEDMFRATQSLTSALDSLESPDETAERIRKARDFGLPTTLGGAITPAEVNRRNAELAMRAATPVYRQMVGDPDFANLSKDDLPNTFSIETGWSNVIKTPGKAEGYWNTAANSWARGGFALANSMPVVGNMQEAESIMEKLRQIEAWEQGIAEGKSNQELFGSETDPDGSFKRAIFDRVGAQAKAQLQEQLRRTSQNIAFNTNQSAQYPHNEALDKLSSAKTFGEAVSAATDSPILTILDIGPESAVQFAPLVPLMALSSGSGFVPMLGRMAISGANSFGITRSSDILGKIGETGVDMTSGEDIYQFLADPKNRPALSTILRDSENHAGGVALFDAISGGLAGKTLLPSIIKKRISSSFGKELAEMAVQTPLQGALGGAGEAVGQIMESGSVTSWGDVVSEVIGEGFSAPVEVLSASFKQLRSANAERTASQERAKALNDLGQTMKASKILARDPETATDYVNNIAESVDPNKTNVLIDGELLHQEGLDQQLAQLMPERAEEIQKAVSEGGEISIPAGEFVTKVGASDLNERLTPYVRVDGEMSLHQAQEVIDSIVDTASSESDRHLEGETAEFRQSVKNVTQEIYSTVKNSGGQVKDNEAKAVSALVSSLISSMAKDIGILPEQIWKERGFTVLGQDSVSLAPDGSIQFTDQAKKTVDANLQQGQGFIEEALRKNQSQQQVSPAEPRIESENANGQQEAAAETLKQDPQTGANRKGDYIPSLRTIIRWFGADQSTLLHESGHWYLDTRIALVETLKKQANLTEAQKRFIEITEKTLNWMGVKSVEEWKSLSFEERRPMHEKFARHIEAYLFEGNAPTAGLRSVFRQYFKWLKKIYSVISGIPGVQMSDDVRVLFDQLFTSSEQAKEARLRRGMVRLFDKFAVSGMTEEAWNEYMAAYADSDEEAIEFLQAMGARDMAYIRGLHGRVVESLRRKKAGIRNRLAAEEAAKLSKTPIYQAMGELFNQHKLTLEELQDAGLTDEQIASLRKKNMIAGKNRTDVLPLGEEYAKKYGYSSFSELAKALADCPKLNETAEALADIRMAEEYAELSSEEEINRAADEAIFNPTAKRILAAEITALEKLEPGKFDVDLFTSLAKKEVGEKSISELRPDSYRRAATARNNEARRLFKKGDIKGAARAKRQALYQTCMAIEAKIAVDRARKELKYFKKFVNKEKIDGMDTGYLIQIQNLLEKAGIEMTKELGKGATSGMTLVDFLNKLAQDGIVPPIDPLIEQALVNHALNVKLGGADLFKSLPIALIEELADAVHTLDKMGREETRIATAEGKAEVGEACGNIVNSIKANAEERGIKPNVPVENGNRFWQWFNQIGKAHARIPALLSAMEGKEFGFFWEYVVKAARACNTREVKLKSEFSKLYYEAIKPLMTKWGDAKRVYYERLKCSLSREQLRAILLNLGNEENFNRILAGSERLTGGAQWTREDVLAVISENLTAEEINAAQAVWDVFEQLRPQVEANEIKLYGRAPLWVKPQRVSFAMPDGSVITLKGGYYPIAYDKTNSQAGASVDELEEARNLMRASRITSKADRGHLKTRVDRVYRRPLTLTLRAGFEGLDSQIHELCWQKWLADTNKIFRNRNLDETIRDYWGPETVTAVKQWITDIAAGSKRQERIGDSLASILRQNLGLVGLGFNLVTGLVQIVGFTQTVAVLGTRWAHKGLAEFLTNPGRAREEVFAKSEAMRDRMRTQFRELSEVQAMVSSSVGTLNNRFTHAAYIPIAWMQMLVDIPTWLGAYNKALSEGCTEQEAVARADQLVVSAQGGGSVMDLSGVERGGEWQKLFTVFYTFFNVALNIAMVTGHTQKGIKRAFNLLLILCMQPIIETFLRQGIKEAAGDGDADDWLEKSLEAVPGSIIGFNLGLLVGIREAAELGNLATGQHAFPYSGPGGLRKINDIIRLGQQVKKDDWDENTMRAFLTVIGEWSPVPIPVVPINRALQGYKADREGKTDNPMAYFFGYSDF